MRHAHHLGLTEPFLAPVRRFLPQTGMFDFSALIVTWLRIRSTVCAGYIAYCSSNMFRGR